MKSAIPENLLAPLGRIVANFALLETMTNFTIGLLTPDQEMAQIITAEISFKQKIGLLSSLYQKRFPQEHPFSELKIIRKKLKDANNKRNDLIHSIWLAGGKKYKITAKEKVGLKYNFEEINLEKINGIADFISITVNDLTKFFMKFK